MEKELVFSKIEKNIGVHFKNPALLRQAAVHRSYLNEHPNFDLNHNERLEFLGDAVLEIIVTEHLYLNYPNPEGELTNWRASLVNSRMLSQIAQKIGIEEALYLSRGETKDIGKARQAILANAFEALIGAIYLDKGEKAAKKFIRRFVLSELPNILENKLYLDPKSNLQEITQEKIGITPVYKVLSETGPDHAKNFSVGVYLKNEKIGEGAGSSKQEAQEAAARDALKKHLWE